MSQMLNPGVGEVKTTYRLDTAALLNMVLAETTGETQTTTYWHGLDLLGQSDGTDWQYFQYDGRESVRQLVDDAGAVQYADTFDPYGNLYASAGSDGQTNHAFTGEQQDGNGLLFLRARYYNASMGRFGQTVYCGRNLGQNQACNSRGLGWLKAALASNSAGVR